MQLFSQPLRIMILYLLNVNTASNDLKPETEPTNIECLNLIDNIHRKTIEGYLDSVSSLTFNTIQTKLIMHAFHSSRYLQSK